MANSIKSIPVIVDRTYQLIKLIQLVFLSLTLLLFGVSAYILWVSDVERMVAIGLLIGVMMVLVGLYLERRVRNQSGEMIMPLLCDYVGGLSYQRHSGFPNGFLDWGLVPAGRNMWAQDRIGGTAGGSNFAIWDAKIRSGNKNQVSLFKGFLIEITDLKPHMRFSVQKQKSEVLASLKAVLRDRSPSDKKPLSEFSVNGATYTISVLDTPTQQSEIEAQVRILAESLPNGARFDAVTQNQGRARIVVSTLYDPFEIGTLLVTRSMLEKRVERALGQLRAPLEIVDHWISAQKSLTD